LKNVLSARGSGELEFGVFETDFSSRIRVLNPNSGEVREALISMNTPFRFGGETYYQGSFDPRNESVTILHVVRNPAWLSPYVACALVGIGLSFHFVVRLLTSLGRERSVTANEARGRAAIKPSSEAIAHEGRFQRWIPPCLVGLAAILVATRLWPRQESSGFSEFGRVPVLLDGRVQPIDSVARNALLAMSGKSGSWLPIADAQVIIVALAFEEVCIFEPGFAAGCIFEQARGFEDVAGFSPCSVTPDSGVVRPEDRPDDIRFLDVAPWLPPNVIRAAIGPNPAPFDAVLGLGRSQNGNGPGCRRFGQNHADVLSGHRQVDRTIGQLRLGGLGGQRRL
jgi:hypothetical protein